MERRRTRWLLLLLVGGAVAAQASAQEAAPSPTVAEQIEAALERYVAAVNAADWETALSFYAADPAFFWIEDGAVRYRSRDEVAEAYAGLGQLFSSFEIGISEVRVVPLAADVATVGLSFEQTMSTESDTTYEVRGAILATMVAREGGWRFLNGHTSSLPPPRPSPPAAQE